VNTEHLIAHPSEDNLALLQSSPAETKALLFRPASAIPYKTHTIPFRLLNVAWYPQLAEPSKFSLVGITEAWNVILFGDKDQRLAEAGTTPTPINAMAQGDSRRATIFQEMFGISAFANVERPLALELSSGSIAKGSSRVAAAILDTPAYLMPPLESLFEPLINGFLQPRPSSLGAPAPGGVEDPEDEEAEMEVDEPINSDEPFIVGARPERVVDAREMDDFVELFIHYGLTC
jgi:NET1-associated nuclear protein 1 (U3 small nucleolar RNA-associated protein 17)